MLFYYCLFFSIVLLILFFLFRSFYLRKKNIPGRLFADALRSENSGQFEQAVIAYTNALAEEKKARFSNSILRNRILERLKVLHTAIEYQNSFHAANGRPVQ